MAEMLKSRAFIVSMCVCLGAALLLAWMPLTGVLGFEFNLIFGALSTIVTVHFTLSRVRQRARQKEGSSFLGLYIRILLASWLLLVLPLAVLCANALRIPNCNFSYGFALFGLYPIVGAVFGTSVGMTLGMLRRQWMATALVYLLPIGCGLAAGVHGLLHPPIFAYDHFFSFYPGSLYDELRSITSTLLLFRLSTLALSGVLIGFVALFAGRLGIFSTPLFDWRDAFIQRSEQLDERLLFNLRNEAHIGAWIWLLACGSLYGGLKYNEHSIGTQHTQHSIQKSLGGRLETPHFILYYDRNTMPPKTLKHMARDHEYRYQQLVRFFGHRPKRKIESYLFRDAQQKSKYMGAARTMIARPWAYQFYLHGYYAPHGVLKHELAHVFTAAFGAGPLKISTRWGWLPNTALIEGVAVAADWSRRQMTPHMWCRAMLDMKRLPDPERLLNPTGFFSYASWTAYTVAGSFSRYLIDRYGMHLYKKAYGTGAFAQVYGRSIRKLSTEWKAFLRQKVHLGTQAKRIVAYRFRRYRSIFARVCPHEIAALNQSISQLQSVGAYPKAIQLQKKICSWAPQTHHLMRLLQLYAAAKQDPKAQKLVHQLLKRFTLKHRPIYHAQLRTEAGKLAYRAKQPDVALRHFKVALKQRVYLGPQRSLQVRIYALQHPKWTSTIMRYLGHSSRTDALLDLQRAHLAHPDEPMLAYLLGRRLYYSHAYKRALRLFKVAQKGLSGLAFQAEILRLQGRSLFALGLYAQASKVFLKRSRLALPKGVKIIAQDWSDRALWEHKVYGVPVRK